MRFKNEYIATGNATEAAARVYKVKNRASAKSIGTENLSKLAIREAIDKDMTTADMDRDWVLRGFKRHAEQTEDKSVSLKAFELTSRTLGMLKDVNINKNDDPIPDSESDRAAERDRLLERLAALRRPECSGQFVPVEPGSIRVQSDIRTAP